MDLGKKNKQIFKYFPMSNCLGNYCEAHTDCTRTEAELDNMPERKVCVEWLICITPCSFILDLITLFPRQLYYNYCSDKNNYNSKLLLYPKFLNIHNFLLSIV